MSGSTKNYSPKFGRVVRALVSSAQPNPPGLRTSASTPFQIYRSASVLTPLQSLVDKKSCPADPRPFDRSGRRQLSPNGTSFRTLHRRCDERHTFDAVVHVGKVEIRRQWLTGHFRFDGAACLQVDVGKGFDKGFGMTEG